MLHSIDIGRQYFYFGQSSRVIVDIYDCYYIKDSRLKTRFFVDILFPLKCVICEGLYILGAQCTAEEDVSLQLINTLNDYTRR